MLTNVWIILPSFILSSIVYINKFFFKRFFFISLWFFIFFAVSEGVWLDELVGFLSFEVGGNLFGGVGGHSFLLLGIELEKSSGGWCWLSIFTAESWNGISDTRWPVFKILSFFSFVSFFNSWLFGCFFGVNFSFCLNKASAILESAFNKVEEVSNEFSFMLFINTFEEFTVHLSLEELIHISL